MHARQPTSARFNRSPRSSTSSSSSRSQSPNDGSTASTPPPIERATAGRQMAKRGKERRGRPIQLACIAARKPSERPLSREASPHIPPGAEEPRIALGAELWEIFPNYYGKREHSPIRAPSPTPPPQPPVESPPTSSKYRVFSVPSSFCIKCRPSPTQFTRNPTFPAHFVRVTTALHFVRQKFRIA